MSIIKKFIYGIFLIATGALFGFFSCMLILRYTNILNLGWEETYTYALVGKSNLYNAKAHLYYLYLIDQSNLDRLGKVIKLGLENNLEHAHDNYAFADSELRNNYDKIAAISEYYFWSKGESSLSKRLLPEYSKANKTEYEEFCEHPDMRW